MRGQGADIRPHQITVRLPPAVWADLMREWSKSGAGSVNDVVVGVVQVELARRRRVEALARIARQRAEVLRSNGAAEDSTRYIRRLREGDRPMPDGVCLDSSVLVMTAYSSPFQPPVAASAQGSSRG